MTSKGNIGLQHRAAITTIMARYVTDNAREIHTIYNQTNQLDRTLSYTQVLKYVQEIKDEDKGRDLAIKESIYRKIAHTELKAFNEHIANFEKDLISTEDYKIKIDIWRLLMDAYTRRQDVLENMIMYFATEDKPPTVNHVDTANHVDKAPNTDNHVDTPNQLDKSSALDNQLDTTATNNQLVATIGDNHFANQLDSSSQD